MHRWYPWIDISYRTLEIYRLDMGCDQGLDHEVRYLSHAISFFINKWSSIVEMTAGIIVCCMPTTAAIFKKLKTPKNTRPPFSSFPTTNRRGFRDVFSLLATTRHEQESSAANLRSIYGDESHQCEIWSGPESSSTESQQDHHMASAFPLDNTTILKTIEINVT